MFVGVSHCVMSQRPASKDTTRRIPSSSCAKHLQFARLQGSGRKCYLPLHVDTKRAQSAANTLPRVIRSEISATKKCQELKVYKSFIGGEESLDKEGKLGGSEISKEINGPGNCIPLEAETTTKALKGHCNQQHAVRRYALYKGMLKQSRFQEDHKMKKTTANGDKASRYDRKNDKDASTNTEPIMEDPNSNHGATSSKTASSNSNKPEGINHSRYRSDDLIGLQFPKRIYIREISNGAIVDEIVDIKDEREWEILNYMTPLRHISSKPDRSSTSLRFRDLRNFGVYYCPYPWR